MHEKSDFYGWFITRLKDEWETEYLTPRSEIKRNRFIYEEKAKIFYIYMWNHNNVIARFEPDRCYLNDSKLNNILVRILPEFIPYFQGQKNFVSGEWEIEG